MKLQINAFRRLLNAEKQVTDPPNNNKNMTWQKKQEDGYKGKPKPPPDRQTPKGTFTQQNPGAIVNDLKQTSEDYGQASKRLNNFINRSGKNLDTSTKQTLYKSKDALRDAYGVKDPDEKTKPVEKQPAQSSMSKTEAGPQFIPRWHMGNQLVLDTGLEDCTEDDDMKLNAAARLLLTADEKWSGEITKHDDHSAVPEGTFKESADHIAKTLKRVSKDKAQAMQRLSFYINRAGDNLSSEDKSRLENAKSKLEKLYG